MTSLRFASLILARRQARILENCLPQNKNLTRIIEKKHVKSFAWIFFHSWECNNRKKVTCCVTEMPSEKFFLFILRITQFSLDFLSLMCLNFLWRTLKSITKVFCLSCDWMFSHTSVERETFPSIESYLLNSDDCRACVNLTHPQKGIFFFSFFM